MKKKLIIGIVLGIFKVEGYQLIEIKGYDEEGKTRIVVTQDGIPQYRVFTMLNPSRFIIDLLNCKDRLPKEKIENTSSVIVSISSQQRLKYPVEIVRVTAILKTIFPYQILSDKNSVIIEMETSLPKKEKIEIKEEPLKEPKPSILPPLGEIKEAIKPKEEKEEKKEKEELISLKFYETDIRDALRLISKKIGMDIVVGPDVGGIVSIELNNVKWDTALNMLLKPYNLSWIFEEGIIRVDIKGNLLKTDIKTEAISINYDKAANIAKVVEPLLDPDAGGKIVVNERTNSLIITTTSQNLEEIKRIIKSLDTSIPQVIIEAKMVQIDQSEVENLGIHWGFRHPSYGSDRTEGEVNLPPGPAMINIGRILGNTELFFRLNNLITKKKAEVIASPKITTSDNQKAIIKVGQQLPYGETTAGREGGEAGITVKFLDVSKELEITPKVNPDQTIALELNIKDRGGKLEKIMVGGQSHDAPFTMEKSVQTKLIVKNGETIVIGGMVSGDIEITETKVPFLSDLPFIGVLFRHTKKAPVTESYMKRELLIFLSSHILPKT